MIKNCASAATRPAEASSETVRSSESLRLSTKTKTCTGLPGRAQDNPAHHTETQIRLDSALGGSILYFVVVDSERQIKHYKSLTHACMHACMHALQEAFFPRVLLRVARLPAEQANFHPHFSSEQRPIGYATMAHVCWQVREIAC